MELQGLGVVAGGDGVVDRIEEGSLFRERTPPIPGDVCQHRFNMSSPNLELKFNPVKLPSPRDLILYRIWRLAGFISDLVISGLRLN